MGGAGEMYTCRYSAVLKIVLHLHHVHPLYIAHEKERAITLILLFGTYNCLCFSIYYFFS